jgi:hypothetical protein
MIEMKLEKEKINRNKKMASETFRPTSRFRPASPTVAPLQFLFPPEIYIYLYLIIKKIRFLVGPFFLAPKISENYPTMPPTSENNDSF